MELQELISPLKKWWWLLLLSALLAVTSSYFYARNLPPTYQTRATLMVGSSISDPNPSGNDFTLAQMLARSYVEMAKRGPVRQATQQALGLSDLPEYNAYVVPQTQLLEIVVVDTDPLRAQAVANELARQLILQGPSGSNRVGEEDHAFVQQQLARLRTSITETEDEISARQAKLADLFSARQIADAEAQIAGLQSKLRELRSIYAALVTASQQDSVNILSIIESAFLPRNPTGPNRMLNVAVALALALALAGGTAYLLEYLDDTVRSRDDVERRYELPVLGTVPKLRRPDLANPLATQSDGQAILRESLRSVSTRLLHSKGEYPVQVLLVTSPLPGDGKTLVSAKLAQSVAAGGRRVILVDADLRRSRLHQLFHLPNDRGVTTALSVPTDGIRSLLQNSGLPGLQLMCAGPLLRDQGDMGAENAATLIESPRMAALITALRQEADLVILDSPPLHAVADATGLATLADGVLVVLRAGHSRHGSIQAALKQLRQVDAHLLGVVLNQTSLHATDYRLYGYYTDPERV